MKTLSVRQPWAWAIVNGYKPVENRNTDFVGSYRGPILIHSGKEAEPLPSWYAVRQLLADSGEDPDELPDLQALPTGGIVGKADLVGVTTHHGSHWFSGPIGIVLANARPLTLIPWRGQLGLFEVDEAKLNLAPPNDPKQGRLL